MRVGSTAIPTLCPFSQFYYLWDTRTPSFVLFMVTTQRVRIYSPEPGMRWHLINATCYRHDYHQLCHQCHLDPRSAEPSPLASFCRLSCHRGSWGAGGISTGCPVPPERYRGTLTGRPLADLVGFTCLSLLVWCRQEQVHTHR